MFGIGLLKGLSVTMRHFIESYLYDRKPWEPRYSQEWLDKHQAIDGKGFFTVQYPEQKRTLPENFRFLPMLVYEETADEPRCTACGICARVCPPQCIWIQRSTDDRGRPRAKPAGFWIDTVVCMSCGFCAEFCPFDAIKMNQDHEIPTANRDRDMFYDLNKLLVPVEYYAKLHPSDYRAEEEERQAKEEAKKAAQAKREADAKEAAAKPEATAEAKKATAVKEPAESAGGPDDLKRIEGIGPKISSVLATAGIATFALLADAEVDRIRQILEEADPNLLRLADPTTWPRQARLAANGKWEALERYQEKLKGGREA
jgi:NADH-quinone oxidoreductase subunit I